MYLTIAGEIKIETQNSVYLLYLNQGHTVSSCICHVTTFYHSHRIEVFTVAVSVSEVYVHHISTNMGDTEFDAAPVDSRCTDARTPGHQGFINRISNRELYERHPRYPRTVDEEPVEPCDLIHIVFVYAKDDYDTFMDFLGWFKEILRTVENSKSVKIETHDSEHFPCPYDDNVHDISERAIFILPYLTKSFCTDKVLRFFTSEAIGKTRLDQTCSKGALENTIKKQKKYAVRPIHTADPRSGTYRIPTGLTMMKGIEFYSKDKHVGYVINQVTGLIKEAIRKFDERKSAMVSALTGVDQFLENFEESFEKKFGPPPMEPSFGSILHEDPNILALVGNGYGVQEQQVGNMGMGEYLTLTTDSVAAEADGNTSLTNRASSDSPGNKQLAEAASLTNGETTLSQTSTTSEGETVNMLAEGKNVCIDDSTGFRPARSQIDTSLEIDNGSLNKNTVQNATQKVTKGQNQNSTDRAINFSPVVRVRKDSGETVKTHLMSYTGPAVPNVAKAAGGNTAQEELKDKQTEETPRNKGERIIVIQNCRTVQIGDGSAIHTRKKSFTFGSTMDDTASNSKLVKMNFNFEDPNIAERLHEVEERYPVGCLPQSLTTPTTDKAKRCLFERIDSTRSNYKHGANMEAFRTTHERIQPWLKALHLYYDMSCEDTRTVDFVDTPFEISPQHPLEKVTVDVKNCKKKFFKVTFFIKSGLIQVQGTSYNEFVSKDLPVLLDIVHKICGPLQEGNLITVHQSNEETSPKTTTSNKSVRLSPNYINAPQNRHDQPLLQAVLKPDNSDDKLKKFDALRDITNHNDLRVEEEKAFQQPASFQQGEPLRKDVDNNFLYLEGQVIYEGKHSERIGCIKVTLNGKESHGTGFRVGSKYFMTAFHVVEDVLILFWKEVYWRLTEEERMQMKWTDDKKPVDGAWILSKLWTFVDLDKKKELIEIGKQFITNPFHIKFGFVKDNKYSSLAQCSYDVAFASPSHDVVILELIEDTKLPNPFHLKTINAAATELHVIGHPSGGKLKHDPACKIIKDQEKLDNLVKEGISFFSARGYTEDQVKKDYEPCVLSPDHLLFHSSKSVAHGASGSPLIVIINEEKAQVIGMLLRGHPKFYYNYNKDNGNCPGLLVESGISMEKVRSLLVCHSLQELAANLFPEEL